jgi:hypothetical protein
MITVLLLVVLTQMYYGVTDCDAYDDCCAAAGCADTDVLRRD